MNTEQPERALYIMIGGFLGAGKSTALGAFARALTDGFVADGFHEKEGSEEKTALPGGVRTVGLITNDQGAGLVDTRNLSAQGFQVAEIAGGCFCCRFDSLVRAAGSLSEATRPDVFLAEPVGSCTDLVASVSYPLRRIYGDDFRIAPLSVLVDPVRARRVLGLESGRRFSDKVRYIYEKQLEEADCLVINKCDSLDEVARSELESALHSRFPDARQFSVSARTGDGLAAWFDYLLTNEGGVGQAMALDYDVYADGEAELGWLNATVRARSESGVDGNALLMRIAAEIRSQLEADDIDIAHLKMTLSPLGGGVPAIGLVQLVRADAEPETTECLPDALHDGELIVNLRAEGPPDALRRAAQSAVTKASDAFGVALDIEHIEHFRPSPPSPTHRLSSPSE